MVNYIIKDEEGIKKYDQCIILGRDKFRSLDNETKIKILELLVKKPMFINEIAKSLKINEQNVYYHMKDMTDILEVVEEKKIRGTIAKKYKPKAMNICLSLSKEFKNYNEFNDLIQKEKSYANFFFPFIKNNQLNAKIIVGSPDPHGQYKARARDGHYAIEFALFLGSFCSLSEDFSVYLDVDIKLKEIKENLILVGGPVTNLIMGEINKYMSFNFREEKHWELRSKKDSYTDDNCGIIARIPNPYYKEYSIMVIAGVRFSGTKAAVLGLTRKTKLVLSRFTEQKEFYAIVQGFDLDGDGKIDSVDLLE
jgi:predicted DNA-binding protein YlxM (UPF0122 family)